MAFPTSDVDLFGDDVLADPYDAYRQLRDLGPVVYLTAQGVFAVTRYAEVRAVLDDDESFRSGEGVGFNDFINEGGQGTTLMSDGEQHRTQRAVISPPLTARAVADLRPQAQALAAGLVDGLVARGRFDAVADLANVLPAEWVPDLLGWPTAGRERLLGWASDTFDALGPMNDRTAAAGLGLLEMTAFAHEVAHSELPPGSMAAGILAAADRGEIDRSVCPMAIIDYLGPSLDTTVAAIGNALWLFATHPEQWQLLREDPARVRQAVNETLRLESPISCFSRRTTEPVSIGGTTLPTGARVLVSFASANRDERRWDEPERFDITRESADHVAFGHGEHACVGMGLARVEVAAILSALAERVEHLELDGVPERKLNNLIRSFGSLPVTVR